MQASFGQLIRHYRQERGLTQEILAKRVGCSIQTIRKLENGERRPSYQMAARLAQILELSQPIHEGFLQSIATLNAAPSPKPADEPRTALALRHLPTYLTPFIGREQEQRELSALLARPELRLLSLVGPGGIGKTRLAVTAATQVTRFTDGVVFVPLAPLNDPGGIAATIIDNLALPPSGGSEPSTHLLSYLRDKRMLLVLDNLEQLIQDDDLTISLLNQILLQAPEVTLLITSRERMRIQAEWVFEVQGLKAPPPDTLHMLSTYPAVRLFSDCVQRTQRDLALSSDDQQAIAAICRLVEGMPLALELAATWARVLSLREIEQELKQAPLMPPRAPHDLPARHRSIQDVCGQSWRMLTAEEQRVLRQLAVFRGGCTHAAAVAVTNSSPLTLAALVDKSLVRLSNTGRYDIHELLRQFALQKLQDQVAEYQATCERHTSYYADWLQQQGAGLLGTQMVAAIAQISLEIGNLRAGWEWAVASNQLKAIERSTEALHWFFEYRCWYHEGEALFRRATGHLQLALLATNISEQQRAAQRRVLAHMLMAHGYLKGRLGQFAAALAQIEQSLNLLSPDDYALRGRALAYQGIFSFLSGDFPRSRQSSEEGLALARSQADSWTSALALLWLGMVDHALGAYTTAESAFREGLALWRSIGNPRSTHACMTIGSTILVTLEKYDEAQALLHESLMISTTINDQWGIAMSLHHLALAAYRQRDYQEAVYLYRETLELYASFGTKFEAIRALIDLGIALSAQGLRTEALPIYREAFHAAMEIKAVPDAIQALSCIAALRAEEQSYEAAFELVVLLMPQTSMRAETRAMLDTLYEQLLPRLSLAQIAKAETILAQPFMSALTVLLHSV